MSAEYDDLFEQLVKFRSEVIRLLTDKDAELAALNEAFESGKPMSKDRIQHHRDAARETRETFEQHNSRAISAFRKYRG